MGLTAASIAYNLIMAGFLLLAVLFYLRHPGWQRFIGGGCALLLLGLFVSLAFCLPTLHLRAARLLCFGWFVQLPLYLLTVALQTRGRQVAITIVASLGIATCAAVAGFAFLIEPFRLEVTHFEINSPLVSQPLKIGVIADFQTDKFEAYERDALTRFMQERPDIILLAGDYLQASSQSGWELVCEKLRDHLADIDFGAPLGVYAVGGNTDFQRWPEIFASVNAATFQSTETIVTDGVSVTGLAIEDSFNTQFTLPSQSQFHIALGHAPDFSLGDVAADLLIAGHTHGGQVCLPWLGPIVTFSQVPRAWASGLTHLENHRTLVVSRGVGMERRDAPRLRFSCRPQLVFITVMPEES